MTEVLTYEALKAERDALAQRVEMLAHNLGNAIWGEQEALQRVNALDRQLSMSEAKCKGYFSDAAAALVKCDALAVENAALINSSVCTLQDGRPQHGFYASEWFIAKLKNGQYAALKALPDEYSHDYRTNDGTYYTKDWVVGWMQTPDTEYRPNVKTPTTDAALAAIRNEATARALKHLCDCQLISSTVAELKATELREVK